MSDLDSFTALKVTALKAEIERQRVELDKSQVAIAELIAIVQELRDLLLAAMKKPPPGKEGGSS